MQNRDYFGCIVPRFEAVRAPNWSQVEAAWPKWCNFTVLRLSSTYLGIIGGYNGSRHQNRIFRGRLGAFLATLGSRESSNAPRKCLAVFHHVGITCILSARDISWGTGAFPGRQSPKTCVSGPFLRDGVTLTVNNSGLECRIIKVDPPTRSRWKNLRLQKVRAL